MSKPAGEARQPASCLVIYKQRRRETEDQALQMLPPVAARPPPPPTRLPTTTTHSTCPVAASPRRRWGRLGSRTHAGILPRPGGPWPGRPGPARRSCGRAFPCVVTSCGGLCGRGVGERHKCVEAELNVGGPCARWRVYWCVATLIEQCVLRCTSVARLSLAKKAVSPSEETTWGNRWSRGGSGPRRRDRRDGPSPARLL